MRLGRYELLARLASGGMGEIFLSRLEGAAGFEKLLVVKRILPHLADDVRFRAMLIAEARIASRMAHANICQVYELGETEGQLYIVMEYLEGLGLLSLLRRASKEALPLDYGFIGGVVQQATEALHYAHELRDRDNQLLGIVHRDVTPGNIFITESGVVKLLDFGIAKVKDVSANTQTGAVKGKYAYMSPEQLRGNAVDRRADVFALGVVIYEMIALRRLFQRKTDYLTFTAVMEQPIPDIRRYRTDAPAALAELLARTLDRDPAGRPATARQLGTAVIDALRDIQRPWTQSEISDFLRVHFASEIDKRRVSTARALQWTAGELSRDLTPASAAAVPSPTAAPAGSADEEDDGFPTVDSDMVDLPLPDHPLDDRRTSEFDQGSAEGNAPPSALISVEHGPADELPPEAGAPRRRLLGPLVAGVMVGIAAIALFLVWKKMRPPDPAVEQGSVAMVTGGSAVPAIGSQGAITLPPGEGSGKATTPPQPPPRPMSPYTAVINARLTELSRCVTDNPPAGAKGTVKVKILLETSGKPKSITFEPPTLDDTRAGECIKHTLSAASFPTAKSDITVTVPITL